MRPSLCFARMPSGRALELKLPSPLVVCYFWWNQPKPYKSRLSNLWPISWFVLNIYIEPCSHETHVRLAWPVFYLFESWNGSLTWPLSRSTWLWSIHEVQCVLQSRKVLPRNRLVQVHLLIVYKIAPMSPSCLHIITQLLHWSKTDSPKPDARFAHCSAHGPN